MSTAAVDEEEDHGIHHQEEEVQEHEGEIHVVHEVEHHDEHQQEQEQDDETQMIEQVEEVEGEHQHHQHDEHTQIIIHQGDGVEMEEHDIVGNGGHHHLILTGESGEEVVGEILGEVGEGGEILLHGDHQLTQVITTTNEHGEEIYVHHSGEEMILDDGGDEIEEHDIIVTGGVEGDDEQEMGQDELQSGNFETVVSQEVEVVTLHGQDGRMKKSVPGGGGVVINTTGRARTNPVKFGSPSKINPKKQPPTLLTRNNRRVSFQPQEETQIIQISSDDVPFGSEILAANTTSSAPALLPPASAAIRKNITASSSASSSVTVTESQAPQPSVLVWQQEGQEGGVAVSGPDGQQYLLEDNLPPKLRELLMGNPGSTIVICGDDVDPDSAMQMQLNGLFEGQEANEYGQQVYVVEEDGLSHFNGQLIDGSGESMIELNYIDSFGRPRKRFPMMKKEIKTNEFGEQIIEKRKRGITELRCMEENCQVVCANVSDLRKHLTNAHFAVFDEETLHFPSQEDFQNWRENYERERMVSFIFRGGTKKISHNQTVTYLICHRSGHYKPTVPNQVVRKRKLKPQGSCKMNGYCTAGIKILRNLDTQVVKIDICHTHYGHSLDSEAIAYLRVNPALRRIIIQKFDEGMSFNEVLEYIHHNPDGLEGLRLVDRRAIRNIYDQWRKPTSKKYIRERAEKVLRDQIKQEHKEELVLESLEIIEGDLDEILSARKRELGLEGEIINPDEMHDIKMITVNSSSPSTSSRMNMSGNMRKRGRPNKKNMNETDDSNEDHDTMNDSSMLDDDLSKLDPATTIIKKEPGMDELLSSSYTSLKFKNNLAESIEKLQKHGESGPTVLYYKKAGDTVINERKGLKQEDHFLLLQSPVQRQILQMFPCILSMDSLQSKNDQLILLVLMVLDEFREALPVAWLVTNSISDRVITTFYELLKENCGDLEAKVLFAPRTSEFHRLYCQVFDHHPTYLQNEIETKREMKAALTKCFLVDSEKKIICKLLDALIYSYNEKFLKDNYLELKRKLTVIEAAGPFMRAFNKIWWPKIQEWSLCYRINNPEDVNTLFACEFFSKLKKFITFKGTGRLTQTVDHILKIGYDKCFVRSKRLFKGDQKQKQISDEILSRHQRAMELHHDQVQEANGIWTLFEENEAVQLTEVKNPCGCRFRCDECEICLHQYVCSCSIYRNSCTMCEHIHLIHLLLKGVLVRTEILEDGDGIERPASDENEVVEDEVIDLNALVENGEGDEDDAGIVEKSEEDLEREREAKKARSEEAKRIRKEKMDALQAFRVRETPKTPSLERAMAKATMAAMAGNIAMNQEKIFPILAKPVQEDEEEVNMNDKEEKEPSQPSPTPSSSLAKDERAPGSPLKRRGRPPKKSDSSPERNASTSADDLDDLPTPTLVRQEETPEKKKERKLPVAKTPQEIKRLAEVRDQLKQRNADSLKVVDKEKKEAEATASFLAAAAAAVLSTNSKRSTRGRQKLTPIVVTPSPQETAKSTEEKKGPELRKSPEKKIVKTTPEKVVPKPAIIIKESKEVIETSAPSPSKKVVVSKTPSTPPTVSKQKQPEPEPAEQPETRGRGRGGRTTRGTTKGDESTESESESPPRKMNKLESVSKSPAATVTAVTPTKPNQPSTPQKSPQRKAGRPFKSPAPAPSTPTTPAIVAKSATPQKEEVVTPGRRSSRAPKPNSRYSPPPETNRRKKVVKEEQPKTPQTLPQLDNIDEYEEGEMMEMEEDPLAQDVLISDLETQVIPQLTEAESYEIIHDNPMDTIITVEEPAPAPPPPAQPKRAPRKSILSKATTRTELGE